MRIVFIDKYSFTQTDWIGVKSIASDGTTYTVTKSDNTTATFSVASTIVMIVN